MSRRAMSRGAGLTLIEVTVALALLLAILVSAFTGLNVTMRTNAAAREHRAASDAAAARLNELMASRDLDALVAAGPSSFHVPVETGNGAVNFRPASAAFFDPGRDDPSMAGHVRFVVEPDQPPTATGDPVPAADPAPEPEDAEDEGEEDDAHEPGLPYVQLLEIQVTVAWRAQDGTQRRVDTVSRRVR